jgi:DnaJ homolog subfamily C member 28
MADKTEDQIRKAIEEGKFDNLPGKGKPLRLDENPFEDPEWRLAHKILRDGGYSLPWIEARQEIEAALQSARQGLSRAWERRQTAGSRGQSWEAVQSEWQRASDLFRSRIQEVNKKIFSYNIETPNDRFQMGIVNPEKEIERIVQGTPSAD